MAKKKKTNPRKLLVSVADVNKARDRACRDSIDVAMVLLFTALRDKEGFGKKRLQRVWEEMEHIMSCIRERYVTYEDLRKVLRDDGFEFLLFDDDER